MGTIVIAGSYHHRALASDVDALLTSDTSVVLVADRGGELVGYVTAHIEHDRRRLLATVGMVDEWLVIEPLRGCGLGRQLFDRMLGELEVSFGARLPDMDGDGC